MYRLLDHSQLLVFDPSPRGLLALAAPFAISRAAAAWMAMWIILGLITARWRHITLYHTPWSWLPTIVFFGAGFWLYSQSGKNFSAKQLGGLPEVVAGHGEQRLVTSGIRARVRHPVYLAHLCEMLAWSIGTGLMVLYGLTALALATGAIMIRMEDRELEDRFGPAYRAYRQQVPAILPGKRNIAK